MSNVQLDIVVAQFRFSSCVPSVTNVLRQKAYTKIKSLLSIRSSINIKNYIIFLLIFFRSLLLGSSAIKRQKRCNERVGLITRDSVVTSNDGL